MAVSRNQILIERDFFKFLTGGSQGLNGENIWMPLGRNTRRWWFVEMNVRRSGAAFFNDAIYCRDMEYGWTCDCVTGGKIWLKTNGLAFTGGDWDYTTTLGYPLWEGYLANHAVTVTVPAGATHLYLYGYPHAAGGTYAVTSSAGTVITPTLIGTPGGSFAAVNAGTGRPMYDSAVLLARNCGGGTVTIMRSTGSLYIMGFVWVNVNAAADPDTGVADPATLKKVLVSADTTPIGLNFGGGAPVLWGGNHWLNDSTLASPVETYTYDTGLTAMPTPTTNTWLRDATTVVHRTLAGTIQLRPAPDGRANCGTFRSEYILSPSGVRIIGRANWNAGVSSESSQVNLHGAFRGGYAIRCGINPAVLNRVRAIPGSAYPVALTNSASNLLSQVSNTLVAQGTDLILTCNCFASHLDSSGVPKAETGGAIAWAWDNGVTDTVLYRPLMAGTEDVPLANGDVTLLVQTWELTDRRGLEYWPREVG
jgi:hypothetical protein